LLRFGNFSAIKGEQFSEMGVNVVQNEEATSDEEKDREEEEKEEPEGDNELVEVMQNKVPAKAATKEPTERSDDPVRMYLREMGTVELLTRESPSPSASRPAARP
jgi:RNA polymerase primary sigma factor